MSGAAPITSAAELLSELWAPLVLNFYSFLRPMWNLGVGSDRLNKDCDQGASSATGFSESGNTSDRTCGEDFDLALRVGLAADVLAGHRGESAAGRSRKAAWQSEA